MFFQGLEEEAYGSDVYFHTYHLFLAFGLRHHHRLHLVYFGQCDSGFTPGVDPYPLDDVCAWPGFLVDYPEKAVSGKNGECKGKQVSVNGRNQLRPMTNSRCKRNGSKLPNMSESKKLPNMSESKNHDQYALHRPNRRKSEESARESSERMKRVRRSTERKSKPKGGGAADATDAADSWGLVSLFRYAGTNLRTGFVWTSWCGSRGRRRRRNSCTASSPTAPGGPVERRCPKGSTPPSCRRCAR
eukprot:6720806-Pyramimonas_sp.AAC.1